MVNVRLTQTELTELSNRGFNVDQFGPGEIHAQAFVNLTPSSVGSVTVSGIGAANDAAAPAGGGNGELVAQLKRTNLNLEEIRDRSGGGSSAGSVALIANGQTIIASSVVTLPELTNPVNPLFPTLNAATLAVAIAWRPSDSYLDNAATNEVAASVVRDCVCWSVTGDPSQTNVALLNQPAGGIAIFSRAQALALRAGAHIEAGGDPVFAHVLELGGVEPASEISILPTTFDIASFTDRGGSGSATTTASRVVIAISAGASESGWVQLPRAEKPFVGLLIPSGAVTADAEVEFDIRRGAIGNGAAVLGTSITVPPTGGYVAQDDIRKLTALSPYLDGEHSIRLRLVRSGAAVNAEAAVNFELNSP